MAVSWAMWVPARTSLSTWESAGRPCTGTRPTRPVRSLAAYIGNALSATGLARLAAAAVAVGLHALRRSNVLEIVDLAGPPELGVMGPG
jgi:hypothetical protein